MAIFVVLPRFDVFARIGERAVDLTLAENLAVFSERGKRDRKCCEVPGYGFRKEEVYGVESSVGGCYRSPLFLSPDKAALRGRMRYTSW